MTQAHRAHRGTSKSHKGEYRHRIGIVEHQGLRAEPLGVVKNIQPDGTSAQRLKDSSWADGVADTLVHAILHRDIEIVAHIGETSHLDGVDDEITSCQQVT